MTTQLAPQDAPATAYELALVTGDLSKLTAQDRLAYYRATCESLGLNPLTRPFDYLTLNSKLTLYPNRGATDQLRDIRGVTITRLERESIGDLYVVTAYAALPDGRQDSDFGAVHTKGLGGEALANAMMKAATKAKRRVTLSICGLSWPDESEVDSIPSARRVTVDHDTGEIMGAAPQIAAAILAESADPDDLPAYRREVGGKAFLEAEERCPIHGRAWIRQPDEPMTAWRHTTGKGEPACFRDDVLSADGPEAVADEAE